MDGCFRFPGRCVRCWDDDSSLGADGPDLHHQDPSKTRAYDWPKACVSSEANLNRYTSKKTQTGFVRALYSCSIGDGAGDLVVDKGPESGGAVSF